MTAVIFKFQRPDQTPVADVPFTVTLRKPTFDEATHTGILLPGDVQGITDAQGECTLDLAHGYGTYYLYMDLPTNAEVADGCLPGLRYKFVVPAGAGPFRVEDLIVSTPTWSRPWDEQALAIITDAKNSARDSAASAAQSAANAHTSDVQSYQNSLIAGTHANNAKTSATNAKASENSAASSRDNAALLAEQARVSAVNSGNSANSASQSATGALNSANAAATSAGQATAGANTASGAATTATQARDSASASAASALASKNSAETAAGTATTKAGEASSSAGTALTQANRAKTEADRAASATDGKQPLSSKLTSLANAIGTAPGAMPYIRDASATAYSFIELCASLSDATPARVLTTGYGGLGTNNNAEYQGEKNTDAYVVGAHSYWGSWTLAGVGQVVGFLSVQSGESGNLAQTITSRSGKVYQRGRNAGTWTEWKSSILSGDNGLQVALLNRNVTPDTSIATDQANSGASFAYTNAAPVAGNDFTVLTQQVSSGYATQLLHDMQNNELFTRVKRGGTVYPYLRTYNPDNVVSDPTAANGGVLQTVAVSGWIVTRFRNGTLVGLLPFQAAGPSIGANEQRLVDWGIPFSYESSKPWHVTASVVPQTDYNYTVPSVWAPVGSIARVCIRNGPTAQTFSASIRFEGFWK